MTETKLMPTEEVGRRVDETLTALNLPDDILRWTWEPATGWQGDPLLRVLFIVRDDFVGSPRFKPFLREWLLPIADALREAIPDRWPMASYRSESEQKEIESGVPLR